MSDSAPPLSRIVRIADVPASGRKVTIHTDAGERAAVARLLGLPAVAALDGKLVLTPFRRAGVAVAGIVTATLTLLSVVSGEAFEDTITAPVDIRFSPDGVDPNTPPPLDELLDPDAEDPPDLLEGDTVDLGAVATEFLALALDPYPRKPGETFEAPADEADASPFGGLSALRGEGGQER